MSARQVKVIVDQTRAAVRREYGAGWRHFSPEMRGAIMTGHAAMTLSNACDDRGSIPVELFDAIRKAICDECDPPSDPTS